MSDSDSDVIEADSNIAKIEENAIHEFSVGLIAQAKQCKWEEHELAQLVIVIAKERDLSDKKTMKFLAECKICKPIVLAQLNDKGLSFTASTIVHAMYEQAGHVDLFIEMIGDGFEQGILSIKDDECIQTLREIGTESFNSHQYIRFTREICCHTEKKKICGKVLHELAGHLEIAEAASFICDIIGYDFFLDLRGTMKGFLGAIADSKLADRIQSLIAETRNTDGEGNILESDEDEKGNLRGFVDDDLSDDAHPYARRRHQPDNDDDDDGEGVFDEECDETRDGENDDDNDEEEDDDDDDDDGSQDSDEEENGDDCHDDEDDDFLDDEEDEDDERARLANQHKRKASNHDPTLDRENQANNGNHSSSGSHGRSKVQGKSKLRKGGVPVGDHDDDDEMDFENDEDVAVGAIAVGAKTSNGDAHHHHDNDSDGSGELVWDAEGGGSPKFQPRRGKSAKSKSSKSSKSSSSTTAVATGRLVKKRRIQDDDDDDEVED